MKYEGSGDVTIAFYQDDVAVSDIPTKENKYYFDHAECNNNATITWDETKWGPFVNNLTKSKTKCNLYFKKISLNAQKCIDAGKQKATDCVTLLSNNSQSDFAHDGTSDNNLRYIGNNPDNYVTFNGELWRIMGVMNNTDNGSGTKESRLKIIRNDSIGRESWDDKGNDGSNDWNTASIKDLLNSSYLNGLSAVAQGMIGNTKWAIGKASYNVTPPNYYNQERGGATWLGKIGLMYPSDYGYSVGGDSRTTCLNIGMTDWINHSECTGNDWLFVNTVEQWTITGYSGNSNAVFHVFSNGLVGYDRAIVWRIIRPTLYLDSNVMISGGTGTSTDPYQLTI